jgi:hypothetical protein
MALPDSISVNDDHSVAVPLSKLFTSPAGAEYADTGRTTELPRLVSIQHRVLGNPKVATSLIDRIFLRIVNNRKETTNGVIAPTIASFTLQVPRVLGLTNALIYDDTTVMKNLLGYSASSVYLLDRMLRGEL